VELPFRIARDHLAPTRRALRWTHPEAAAHLAAGMRALGLDVALLHALMRRESQFRTDARSLAGARGLLQLVPSTAERVAALAGLPVGAADRLDDPDLNVSLGAHYLSLLRDRFRDPALVAAAYNAGPRAVASWASERAGMPLDAWVESIPWRETRLYVKIVLPAQATYRDLWGEPGDAIDPGRKVTAPPDGIAF
jgi:soluble lytic murein transglycosylase